MGVKEIWPASRPASRNAGHLAGPPAGPPAGRLASRLANRPAGRPLPTQFITLQNRFINPTRDGWSILEFIHTTIPATDPNGLQF